MKKVKLNILGLSYSQTQTGAYALVLSEADGNRRIPIIIGAVEAQAIAIQLEGLKPPRPLTHDLFLNVALALIDQSFEDDWDVFGDFGHDRAERRDRVGGEGIVSACRVDLAHVDFGEPTPKFVQEQSGFGHTRINLPSMANIEAEASLR